MAHTDSNGMFDDPRVIGARQKFARYGATKVPSDPYEYDRWQMAAVHGIIFNCLEAVYKNSTRVRPRDISNFLPVARDALDFLHHHHALEESLYFPVLEEAGMKMDENKAQHHEIVPVIEEALAYVNSVDPKMTPNSKAAFDPYRLREILDRMLVPTAVHMAEELDTISPERLREHNALDAAKKGREAVNASIQKNDDFLLAVPRVLYSRDPGCGFPDIVPDVALKLLAPICSLAHFGRRKYMWAMRRWEKVPPVEASRSGKE